MTWFAIRTSPQREFAVEQILTNHGLKAFCPTEVKWKRVGRRKKPHCYPLLARYIFAAGEDLIHAVRMLRDRGLAQGFVGIDGVPATIEESAILRLARMSGAPVPTNSAPVRRSFAVGDKVEIMVGPLQALVVEVASIKGRAAKVIVPMLGTERVVEIPVESLEAA
jgi:transcription antitermination factor NusG